MVGVRQDLLIPCAEQRYVWEVLAARGRGGAAESRYEEANSVFGHDMMFHKEVRARWSSVL